MNQIRAAATRIHPFHLGCTAIVITIATNEASKEYVGLKGQAWLYTRTVLRLLQPLAQSSSMEVRIYAGALFRVVL